MASSALSPRQNEALGDRFSRFTKDDHSAVLWIVSLLSLIYASLLLLVRLTFVKNRAHGFDDVAITLAHVCLTNSIAPTSIIMDI